MDGSSIPIFVLLLIVLIMLSAYFSASETAFSSYNRVRMKSEAEDKKGKKARRVLFLSENILRALCIEYPKLALSLIEFMCKKIDFLKG